jgi:hypothetical protein
LVATPQGGIDQLVDDNVSICFVLVVLFYVCLVGSKCQYWRRSGHRIKVLNIPQQLLYHAMRGPSLHYQGICNDSHIYWIIYRGVAFSLQAQKPLLPLHKLDSARITSRQPSMKSAEAERKGRFFSLCAQLSLKSRKSSPPGRLDSDVSSP